MIMQTIKRFEDKGIQQIVELLKKTVDRYSKVKLINLALKYSLLLILIISFSRCNKENLPEDKVLLLKIDFTTNTFEGGHELSFNNQATTFTITNEYHSPGDFGSITLFYSEIDATLFSGTIIWAGCGKISYPEQWLSAEDFERTFDEMFVFPSNGFENVFNYSYETEHNYNPVWNSVQQIIKVREYLATNPNQKVKIFLYQPSVGDGDSNDWKWILFLNDKKS